MNIKHTKHLQKDNTGKGRGGGGGGGEREFQLWAWMLLNFLFFDSAKEASKDVNTFLNLRFIKKQKPVVFWEIITR